jgi:hypothetical protein
MCLTERCDSEEQSHALSITNILHDNRTAISQFLHELESAQFSLTCLINKDVGISLQQHQPNTDRQVEINNVIIIWLFLKYSITLPRVKCGRKWDRYWIQR